MSPELEDQVSNVSGEHYNAAGSGQVEGGGGGSGGGGGGGGGVPKQ